MISLKRLQRIPQLRRYLPWTVAAAVFAFSYPWFFQPIRQAALADRRAAHMDTLYRERLDNLQRLIVRQRHHQNQLEQWKQEFGDRLFSPAQADAFFTTLDETAASFGCRILSAEYQTLEGPLPALKNPDCPVVLRGAKIQLTGRYDRWIPFLEWIESRPETILISSVRLQSAKEQPGMLNGRMDLAIAVLKEIRQTENDAASCDKEN